MAPSDRVTPCASKRSKQWWKGRCRRGARTPRRSALSGAELEELVKRRAERSVAPSAARGTIGPRAIISACAHEIVPITIGAWQIAVACVSGRLGAAEHTYSERKSHAKQDLSAHCDLSSVRCRFAQPDAYSQCANAIIPTVAQTRTRRTLSSVPELQCHAMGSPLPARHLAIWPALALVDSKRLGDRRQLACLLGTLGGVVTPAVAANLALIFVSAAK
jgi:hypothetical protein